MTIVEKKTVLMTSGECNMDTIVNVSDLVVFAIEAVEPLNSAF